MNDQIKLNNSETRIMNVLWEKGQLPAKEVALEAAARYGWNKNTTYTILKALIEKDYLRREEPNFVCVPLLKRGEVQRAETRGLIDRLFGGSPANFLSAFVENEELSDDEIAKIRRLIDEGEER